MKGTVRMLKNNDRNRQPVRRSPGKPGGREERSFDPPKPPPKPPTKPKPKE